MPNATYDPTLSTDRDWVRFLTGDRDLASPHLTDDEIDAIVREEGNKYLAAARAGEIIISRGLDAVSKSVGDLSISFGSGSPQSAYRSHLAKIREKGAREVSSQDGKSSVLRQL